jgi:hypothetical protein
MTDKNTKGGIMHLKSEGLKVLLTNNEFQRCVVHGRNLIYVSWSGNDISGAGTKIATIANTVFSNCSAAVPGMRILSRQTYDN